MRIGISDKQRRTVSLLIAVTVKKCGKDGDSDGGEYYYRLKCDNLGT